MSPADLYACLSDPTRLRIMRLLTAGPLCVCHVHEALAEPQVKVSKHLAYLKSRGLVEAVRQANWMIYSLPRERPPVLRVNLKIIAAPVAGDREARADLSRLAKIRAGFTAGTPACVREQP